MTRKDYIKAAKIVAGKVFDSKVSNKEVKAVVEAFVELFSADNPSFDKERFYKACQVSFC